jgi:hypothetical protein
MRDALAPPADRLQHQRPTPPQATNTPINTYQVCNRRARSMPQRLHRHAAARPCEPPTGGAA